MKLKKLISVGVVAATLATTVLTGCGSSDSSEAEDGRKNLSVFIFANDHESAVYKDMIAKFQETTRIRSRILISRSQHRKSIPRL